MPEVARQLRPSLHVPEFPSDTSPANLSFFNIFPTYFTAMNGHTTYSERSIARHQEEKDLPGGWMVLKFGGTSVGKFAENIAEIVQ